MAEQTFRSPGFFEREIDLAVRRQTISGVPGGVIGTSVKGPAFVPVTVGDFADFINRFGGLDPDRPAVYAAHEFLKNKRALTFMRVLGAGANETAADRTKTRTTGLVKSAGFRVEGVEKTVTATVLLEGGVNLISGVHSINDATASREAAESFPILVDNASISSTSAAGTAVSMLRAVVFTAKDHRLVAMAKSIDLSVGDSVVEDKAAQNYRSGEATISDSEFRLAVLKSGVVVKTTLASLDPDHPSYISKILNTNLNNFLSEGHYLYLDLPVENELAGATKVLTSTPSTSDITSKLSGAENKARSVLGRFDTRFRTAKSTPIISQPYGNVEFDLFHVESLSDGAIGGEQVKISIANIKASTDPNVPFGTFELQVRKLRDSDSELEILESYPNCSLDPNAENYVARVVGDYKVEYNFDADLEEERRLLVSGKYPNRSLYVRVVMSDKHMRGEVPSSALPFGFRGLPVLKTTDSLTDNLQETISVDGSPLGVVLTKAQIRANIDTEDKGRIHSNILNLSNADDDAVQAANGSLLSPIFPPMPYRYKVTRGKTPLASSIGGSDASGNPSIEEKVDSKMYWGLKTTRMPRTGSISDASRNPNAGSLFNELVVGYTKFQGMAELDALVTGSAADEYNSNKFTLARVALNKVGSGTNLLQHITGSAKQHMLEAVYLRSSTPDTGNYTITDGAFGDRVTLGTLVASSSVKFNRFVTYNKFTLPLYGGFDGLNILDKDMLLMNDRSTSTDAPLDFNGKASNEFNNDFAAQTGLNSGLPGVGLKNNAVNSYRSAARIMTDPMTVSHNILAIPGIRDSFVTDFVSERVKDYSLAIYLMDIPGFSESGTRLFGTEDRDSMSKLDASVPDVRETSEQLSTRVIDNNYTAAYFPDVVVADESNSTQVKLPASVAAMKALAFSDSVSFPWFAPAGFNRGALDSVTNVDIRLTAGDRDELYSARINPIANFPDGGFVIFGQKTLQMAKSALDRVNVRRLLLEIKRLITGAAQRLLFEPNNAQTRARFINLVTPLLATIQAQAGVDSFRVVMDDTNNTPEDVENNRLNGRIVVVPTRAIEFIAIDFIITNSGVSFE